MRRLGAVLVVVGAGALVASAAVPWFERCVGGGRFFDTTLPEECFRQGASDLPLAAVVVALGAALAIVGVLTLPAWVPAVGAVGVAGVTVAQLATGAEEAIGDAELALHTAAGPWIALAGAGVVLAGAAMRARRSPRRRPPAPPGSSGGRAS